MQRRTRKRTTELSRCLFEALAGTDATFEMRNGMKITGEIQSCDRSLNVWIESEEGPTLVRGTSIRYVVLSDTVDVPKTLEAWQRVKEERKSSGQRKKKRVLERGPLPKHEPIRVAATGSVRGQSIESSSI